MTTIESGTTNIIAYSDPDLVYGNLKTSTEKSSMAPCLKLSDHVYDYLIRIDHVLTFEEINQVYKWFEENKNIFDQELRFTEQSAENFVHRSPRYVCKVASLAVLGTGEIAERSLRE